MPEFDMAALRFPARRDATQRIVGIRWDIGAAEDLIIFEQQTTAYGLEPSLSSSDVLVSA